MAEIESGSLVGPQMKGKKQKMEMAQIFLSFFYDRCPCTRILLRPLHRLPNFWVRYTENIFFFQEMVTGWFHCLSQVMKWKSE